MSYYEHGTSLHWLGIFVSRQQIFHQYCVEAAQLAIVLYERLKPILIPTPSKRFEDYRIVAYLVERFLPLFVLGNSLFYIDAPIVHLEQDA
jgi:hypothetical protein